MRPVTENMSQKELIAVVRELATRAVPLDTTGAPAASASFKGQLAIDEGVAAYIAVSVGLGAADWVLIS